MKKLIPAILPFVLIAALFAILMNTSKLSGWFNPFSSGSDDESDAGKAELEPPLTDPVYSPAHNSNIPPRAVIVGDKDASASVTKAPFVRKSFQWKVQGNWRYKHTITFNTDGSVTQDLFPKSRFTWRPNNRYSAILKSGSGWVADIAFDTHYKNFTARRRGNDDEFQGKAQ